jgi:hypothetical protein
MQPLLNQAAIIALFRIINHYVGNVPPLPTVFPDSPAPVVRNAETSTELIMMRWAAARRRPAGDDQSQHGVASWRAWPRPEETQYEPSLSNQTRWRTSTTTLRANESPQWPGIKVNKNRLNLPAYAGVTRVCVGRVMMDRTNSETLVERPGIAVKLSISWTFG